MRLAESWFRWCMHGVYVCEREREDEVGRMESACGDEVRSMAFRILERGRFFLVLRGIRNGSFFSCLVVRVVLKLRDL